MTKNRNMKWNLERALSLQDKLKLDGRTFDMDSLPRTLTQLTKVNVTCSFCQSVSNLTLKYLEAGKNKCQCRSERVKLTIEKLFEVFKKIANGREIVIESIPPELSMEKYLLLFCNECEQTTKIKIRNLIHDRNQCPICNSGEKWTVDRIQRQYHEIENIFSIEFENLPEIKNSRTKIKVKCLKCDLVQEKKLKNLFYQKNGCLNCNLGIPWTKERILREFPKISDNRVIIWEESDFIFGNEAKITTLCMICNKKSKQTIGKIFNRLDKCVYCSASSGERLVAKILDEIGIEYIKEFSSKNIDGVSKYRFDFAVPQYKILIEFHGVQHYEAVNFGSTKRNAQELFEYGQKRDKAKEKIAKDYGYELIIIPYTLKDNPDEIKRMVIEAIHFNNF
jgi:very-short-patch-repair endonuclease